MVIYDLECSLGHRFEGWFPSIDAFGTQLEKCFVTCNQCGSKQIKKIPSGGHIMAGSHSQPQLATSTNSILPNANLPATQTPQTLAGPTPALSNVDPVVLLKTLHQFIKTTCKDVGPEFADKAIQMQHGEIPKEPIHGTATDVDYEKMADEGVEYSLIPKLPEEFNH